LDEDDDEEEDQSNHIRYLRRNVTTHDRRFRSRLPRKKTYIQVYTQANDLVQEDIDDEFYPGGDQPDDNVSIISPKNRYKIDHDHRHGNSSSSRRRNNEDYFSTRRRDPLTATSSLPRRSQDNGDEADNDDNDISDDSDDDSDKDHIDYFSSFAPYTHKVIEGATAVLVAKNTMEAMEIKSPTNVNPLQQQYLFAKPYFPFSDEQLESSGLSGEDETERDLPSATELLMAHQPNIDGMTLTDLHNIHPDAIVDETNVNTAESTRAAIAEALDDGRHSPEKISFMKTLTNFLTDSGVGNLLPLESPL
jgi:1-phosphatidylinositol-3-phosphate 5-kinase